MKRSIFILVVFITISFVANAQRSQEAFTMKIKTPSEVRAYNLIENLCHKIELSPEQKEELADVVRDYIDEAQRAQEKENREEILAKLQLDRDKQAKRILLNKEYLSEFQVSVNELQVLQGRGYQR